MLYIMVVMESKTLYICDLATLGYQQAWETQLAAHRLCLDGEVGGIILTLEHPPVLTMGKNSSSEHLLANPEQLRDLGVGFVHTDRGGEVTAHEPGQLVFYGILPLRNFGLSPKSYICMLESFMIDTLAEFRIVAERDPKNPGVWVDKAKVGAVGVRIKDRVAMHGFSLNVCNDLTTFEHIIPCGIKDRTVTTVSQLLQRTVSRGEVGLVLNQKIRQVFKNLIEIDSKQLNQLILKK